MSDILIAAQKVEEFTADIKTLADYEADAKTRSAVERQLAIIGEAVNRFLKAHPNNQIDNAAKIIGFRNWLIHAYDAIDNTTVWAILKRHLPKLRDGKAEGIICSSHLLSYASRSFLNCSSSFSATCFTM
ncbi:MAG: HepT-like ribonuclease domain-containing protein [Bacteroidia bacterium]